MGIPRAQAEDRASPHWLWAIAPAAIAFVVRLVPVLRGGTHSVACHMSQEDRTQIYQQEVLPNL